MPTPKTARKFSGKHNHTTARCPADSKPRARSANAPEPTSLPWELHIGFSRLTIIGPGDQQWFAASPPYYTGQVGTSEERETAARAVAILNAEHRNHTTADTAFVNAILNRASNLS